MKALEDNVLFRNGHTMGLMLLVKGRIEENFPAIRPETRALMYEELAAVLRTRAEQLKRGEREGL